jgi:hypothetical protein
MLRHQIQMPVQPVGIDFSIHLAAIKSAVTLKWHSRAMSQLPPTSWRDPALRPFDDGPGPHVPQRGSRPDSLESVWSKLSRLLRKKPVRRQLSPPRSWTDNAK